MARWGRRGIVFHDIRKHFPNTNISLKLDLHFVCVPASYLALLVKLGESFLKLFDGFRSMCLYMLETSLYKFEFLQK